MPSDISPTHWLGNAGSSWGPELDEDRHLNQEVSSICHLAKSGDWTEMLAGLQLSEGPVRRAHANLWDPRSGSGFTLLHHAAWHGADESVVTRLLDLGAWRLARDLNGRNPLDVARERHHAHLEVALQPRPLSKFGLLTPAARAELDRNVKEHIMMLCFPSRVLNYTWPRTEVLMESDRPLIGIVEGAHAGYTIWHGRRHVVLSGYGPHDDGLNEMSRGVWLITPRTTVHVDDAEIE